MITLDTIVRGFGKVIGGAALGLSLYACSGEPAQPNPNENDTNSYDTKDTYNPKDLGYDSNDALDAYISKRPALLRIESSVVGVRTISLRSLQSQAIACEKPSTILFIS